MILYLLPPLVILRGVAVRLTFRIRLPRQDDGVAAGEARADRDHRREGSTMSLFHSGIPSNRVAVGGLQVFCPREFRPVFFMCCFLSFQAKEVRRKADQMVQLGKDVRPLVVY